MPKPSNPLPSERQVIYPEIEVKKALKDKALTAEQAKSLLGWCEADKEKALLKDEEGKWITCVNNTRNRPFYESWARSLAQDMLNRNWRFNAQPIIIGKTGEVLDGQHRLIGLVLAEQLRVGRQKAHWMDLWADPVTIEVLVVRGMDEDNLTTRTLDNTRSRSLTDVLFCDPDFLRFFGDVSPSERRTICNIADKAVRLLWFRAWSKLDAFRPRRTHSESVDFIEKHPKIRDCVLHIFKEDRKGGIRRYITPGTAAGLLYLMGSSSSDMDDYRTADERTEALLSWDNWKKALNFWSMLASNVVDQNFRNVKYAIGALADPDGESTGSLAEKTAVICKAWRLFVQGYDMTEDDLKLRYFVDDNGVRTLNEPLSEITVGGIDLGFPNAARSGELDNENGHGDGDLELSEEELERRKAEQRRLRMEEEKKKILENRSKRKNNAAGDSASINDDNAGEPSEDAGKPESPGPTKRKRAKK